MNKNYQVSGKSTTLKRYADVDDTIEAIQRIVKENYLAVRDLSLQMEGDTEEETFHNIWYFVRNHIRYKNDEIGVEQLRTPQRTLHDRIGDCDDFSILISSMLTNLEYNHYLVIAAYKKKNQWQHIYPVVHDENGIRYVLDCVPEIPYFNYEAKPIKNRMLVEMNRASLLHSVNPIKNTNMRLEELGEAVSADMLSELTQPFDINALSGFYSEEDELETIQGLLGNIAIVDELDDFDTVLSGSELQRNIILKQLMDAKKALESEVSSPSDMSQVNDNRTELRLVNDIINNFNDEASRDEAIRNAIRQGTLYQNFYKAAQFGLNDAVNGLNGEEDEDQYYLKVMDEQGMFDDLEGLGLFKKLKSKIKAGVQKFKEKHPKLAKVGHALKKFSPATFTLRKTMEPFLRANVFHMAEKLAIGYASESEAKKLGYSQAEWKQFVEAKDKAEQKWYALGGDKAYFKKMVMNGRGAKKAGLRGQLGVAPAIIAAVTKVFGVIIGIVKKLKLRKKDGSIVDESQEDSSGGSPSYDTKSMAVRSEPSDMDDGSSDDSSASDGGNVQTDEKSGVTTETVTDENGKETTIYKDKDGNEIGKFKAFFLKNKTMIIIVGIVITVGIAGLIIWKIRQRSLRGLGAAELSKKQENFIKRQGLNNRAYASLVREEIKRDKKPYNENTRKTYYKKVFQDAFSRPLSQKQVSAAHNYNRMYSEVRQLAKAKGGGSKAWRDAWAEVKKKA